MLLSGFATLSWEVIWQIKSTLALGVSAFGAAITLAVMMGGISLGGFLMGQVLCDGASIKALRVYGLLEVMIGFAGLFLELTFRLLETWDTWAHTAMPSSAPLIHIFGIVMVIGIPTICMGATFPVIGLIAEQYEVSIAKLYSLNTFGAAVGVLFAALMLIPFAGVTLAIWIISSINITVGICACLLISEKKIVIAKKHESVTSLPQPILYKEIFIVFVTGFATLTLEIAWFRSLSAIFLNTTDTFAIMLASVLIALSLAANKVLALKKSTKSLGMQVCLAGILILLITPLIERFDMLFTHPSHGMSNTIEANLSWLLNQDTYIANRLAIFAYSMKLLMMFFLMCLVIVPPMRYLGVAFPWILDKQRSSRVIGKLYTVNTIAAVVGSIGAAWLLLPTLGFVKTSWIAGTLVVVTGMSMASGSKRIAGAILGIMALLVAVHFETGIGRARVQGIYANLEGQQAKVLESFEGPDETVSAIEYKDGTRSLLINSMSATAESGTTARSSTHYMAWLGHLPMLLQLNPKNALAICFGTGQTANAVRKENPQSLDVVDVNPRIFKLAHHFKSNEDVLHDPKVKTIVMDGRAYLRRTKKMYDVITLEPMPPVTVGTNALYSKEFYVFAKKRLAPHGVIAQWLPFHVVAPHYAASIAKTFITFFPNSILWIDPESKNGILLGTNDAHVALASTWPGFARTATKRNLSQAQVQASVVFDPTELARYSSYGEIISDDNQLLAYGKALYANVGLLEANLRLVKHVQD